MLSLSPTPPTETGIEPFQATLIEDCHGVTSINPYWADQDSIIVVLTQNFSETVFLHLTTFRPVFLHLRLELFLHFWLKEFLQLRMIFTNEADVFTYVVDFYIMNFFYICGCNRAPDMKRMDYFFFLIFLLSYNCKKNIFIKK